MPLFLRSWALTAMALKTNAVKQDGKLVFRTDDPDSLAVPTESLPEVLPSWLKTLPEWVWSSEDHHHALIDPAKQAREVSGAYRHR